MKIITSIWEKISSLATTIWDPIHSVAISIWKTIRSLAIAIWNIKIQLIGALIGLYWAYYSYNKYEFDVFISYFALLVAAIAALAALMSLKLTRDTIRPFLSFNGTINVGDTTLAFPITNTGSMPANDITFRVDAFGIKEAVGLKDISKKYKGFFVEPVAEADGMLIIFPNQTWQQVLGPLSKDKYGEWWSPLIKGEIKLRISIKYKSLNRKHRSIQTFRFDQYSLSADNKHLHGISVEPQKWA